MQPVVTITEMAETKVRGDKSAIQYVVMSGTADGTANYLQLTSDPTKGTIDPTNKNGRMSFDASNPDFVNYNNEILIGMNYPSQGGTAGPSQAWKLVDGQLVEHGSRLQLDGDVKARCFFNDYLLGLSDQATDNDHTSRVKFIKVSDFSSVTTNGVLDCDDSSKEPASQMTSQYGNEAWGVGDMAQYGDYVLLAYTTKHTVQDNNYQRAKASYGTDLDKNFYLGVYKFDPTDADKEYLKFQNMIIRKSEDHVGQEAGQIKGNSRSRTETGIEVVGDNIYLFCQGGKNFRSGNMEVPSAVLRISGSNIQSGKPVAIDNDYYVNLNDKTGNRYLWRCYYLGDNKFCLQLFTNPRTGRIQRGYPPDVRYLRCRDNGLHACDRYAGSHRCRGYRVGLCYRHVQRYGNFRSADHRRRKPVHHQPERTSHKRHDSRG